jgi:hypothetical protein
MHYSPILAPVVALAAWSLVMLLWLYATRIPALKRNGISIVGRRGDRPGNLDGLVEDEVQWKSHNFSNLMEQPTIFYAIALSLALMDMGGGINLWLAWAYVGLRIVHSLIHATVNIILYRFALFSLASLCLLGLTVHAGFRILHDCGIIG